LGDLGIDWKIITWILKRNRL